MRARRIPVRTSLVTPRRSRPPGTGWSGKGRSKALAREAGIIDISVPESTRKLSACQPPELSLSRRSSSARSRMSPVFQRVLPRSGVSRRAMASRLPDLDLQALLGTQLAHEPADLVGADREHFHPLRDPAIGDIESTVIVLKSQRVQELLPGLPDERDPVFLEQACLLPGHDNVDLGRYGE